MATEATALIQAGSFDLPTGSTNLHIGRGIYIRTENLRNVTGASGGSADTDPVHLHGIATEEVICNGRLRLDADSTYALSQSSFITPGFKIVSHNAQVRKRFPLVDVTGSKDGAAQTEKNWMWGLSQVSVSCTGTVESDFGDSYATNSVTTAWDIDDFGTLTGTLKLGQKQITMLHQSGGPVPMAFSGVYSGGVTYTGTNYSWLFPSTDAPVKGTLTADIDTANNLSHAALLYDIIIAPNLRDGGEVPCVCRFRFDQADAE